MGRAHDCEDAGFCLPAPSNLLAEFCWRQPDKMCTCTYSLATFLAAPSNFLSLPSTAICYKNNSIHRKQLSQQLVPEKKNLRIKHLRSANWVAPTCPQGMFLIFLKEWGLDFPLSSQTIPIKFLLFSSITHQNPFVPIEFPKNSHQIPLVPINNPSKSFCSHRVPLVPINNPSKFFFSHRVPKQFPSNSSCSHQ